MNGLLEMGLANAVVATVLAIVAAAVAKLGARPAVVHGLWLLVLLKLITPALVSLPVAVLPAVQTGSKSELCRLPPPAREMPRRESLAAQPSSAGETSVADFAVAQSLPQTPDRWPASDWQSVLCPVWLAGSTCWFLVAAARVVSFHRLVRRMETAPSEWTRQVAGLASRFGLSAFPDVRVIEAILPPMVWSSPRRPVLLLPRALFMRLGTIERATLLGHELAHLCRGDHYVRWFEAIVLGLFWWHPVAWIACRAAQNAAERCCDEWVLRRLPGSNHPYANTLFETANFLTEIRCVLPLGASGFGRTFPCPGESRWSCKVQRMVRCPAAHGSWRLSPWERSSAFRPCSSVAASRPRRRKKTSLVPPQRHRRTRKRAPRRRRRGTSWWSTSGTSSSITRSFSRRENRSRRVSRQRKRTSDDSRRKSPICTGRLKPPSAARRSSALEKKAAVLQDKLAVQVKAQKQEFLHQEVKIYRASWDDINAAITRYAKQRNIDMVLRHRKPETINQPARANKKGTQERDQVTEEAQLLQYRINAPVIYQSLAARGDEEDITREVLAVLNGKQ